MSYTEVHFLDNDNEKSFQVGEIKNAFRGAMYVWNLISKKYFDLDGFPMFDENMMGKVWNAGDHKEVPEHELFVLSTTMDNATIPAEEKEYAVKMMRKFQEENPNSSIGEQADLIEACESTSGRFAFCQTSVTDFWGLEFNEETEEYEYMDLDGDIDYFCSVKQTKKTEG